MKKNILLVCLLAFLVSCNRKEPKEAELVFSCDMDRLSGWSDNPTLFRFKGHSGDYVSKTDTVYLYSPAFKKRLGDITTKPILRAQVSAWVYATDIVAKGNLVCSMDTAGGGPYVYLAEPFEDKIEKEKRWTKISSVFYFPKAYNPDLIFAAYVWNTGKVPLYVDDLEIKLTNY